MDHRRFTGNFCPGDPQEAGVIVRHRHSASDPAQPRNPTGQKIPLSSPPPANSSRRPNSDLFLSYSRQFRRPSDTLPQNIVVELHLGARIKTTLTRQKPDASMHAGKNDF